MGSGYSYLQEWLPNVAQAVVARGLAHVVGIGRLALSYPTLATDVLGGRRSTGRTCVGPSPTAPRRRATGSSRVAIPLDEFYKASPERRELARIKRG